jgi:cytochrome c peroxidase
MRQGTRPALGSFYRRATAIAAGLVAIAASAFLMGDAVLRPTLAAEPADSAISIPPPSPLPPRLLRTLAHNPSGYDPARAPAVTDLLLGDLLFHSPEVLGPKAASMNLSCNTCHPNGSTHPSLVIPGLSDRPGNVDLSTAHFRRGAEDGISDPVNIPSLRGARFTGPYGVDGRTASLAEFIQGVVTGEFGGAPLRPSDLSALVRYVQDFDFMPNPNLDARGRLRPTASDAARRGEALFSKPFAAFSGRSCATCHAPDRFFRDGEVHRIGSGRSPSPYSIDDGYETPTLLGSLETAPYFHDGRFATLAEVVAWFDMSYSLSLTAGDRADLVAYLEAVGAAEKREDDRSIALRMVDTFAYLLLLLEGESRDERAVWKAALSASLRELSSRKEPAAVAARAARARERLLELRARAASDKDLAPMRSDVLDLHRGLVRLAADWAGAVASEGR